MYTYPPWVQVLFLVYFLFFFAQTIFYRLVKFLKYSFLNKLKILKVVKHYECYKRIQLPSTYTKFLFIFSHYFLFYFTAFSYTLSNYSYYFLLTFYFITFSTFSIHFSIYFVSLLSVTLYFTILSLYFLSLPSITSFFTFSHNYLSECFLSTFSHNFLTISKRDSDYKIKN